MRLLGGCLLAAVMVMVLRQMNAPAAGLLSAAFGIMALTAMLPQIRSYTEEMLRFLQGIGLEDTYYRIMLKAAGIVLVTQIATSVCQDMGAVSVAGHAEMCGRLALLGVTAPVFLSLARVAVGVLG